MPVTASQVSRSLSLGNLRFQTQAQARQPGPGSGPGCGPARAEFAGRTRPRYPGRRGFKIKFSALSLRLPVRLRVTVGLTARGGARRIPVMTQACPTRGLAAPGPPGNEPAGRSLRLTVTRDSKHGRRGRPGCCGCGCRSPRPPRAARLSRLVRRRAPQSLGDQSSSQSAGEWHRDCKPATSGP